MTKHKPPAIREVDPHKAQCQLAEILWEEFERSDDTTALMGVWVHQAATSHRFAQALYYIADEIVFTNLDVRSFAIEALSLTIERLRPRPAPSLEAHEDLAASIGEYVREFKRALEDPAEADAAFESRPTERQ